MEHFIPKLSKHRVAVLLLVLCMGMGMAQAAQAALVWHWEGQFSEAEQQKLVKWIKITAAGLEQHIAPYPFDVHITFKRTDRGGEPVPWAHTIRSERQGIKFHVNPSYTLKELLADWTAPHELSHLVMPYLGRRYAWFAEGFASYMQYQVMQRLDLLTETQVREKYRSRIERAKNRYNYPDRSFIAAAPKLRANHEYPTLHWGGAVYFLQVEQALKTKNTTLPKVLSRYLKCCYQRGRGFQSLLAELDRLSETTAFSDTFTTLQKQAGFPVYQE